MPIGIPDFRSPGEGLWENVDPMEVAHIDAFRRDPVKFWSFYRPRFHLLGDKEPNGAHEALAELERRGLLEAVITQNIDMLHIKAGSERVIEVHGSIRSASCQSCGAHFPIEPRRRSLRRRRCGALLLLLRSGQAGRRAVRRAASRRGHVRGGGAVGPRRPDALHRVLARGLSRRRASRGDDGSRRSHRASSPRARPRSIQMRRSAWTATWSRTCRRYLLLSPRGCRRQWQHRVLTKLVRSHCPGCRVEGRHECRNAHRATASASAGPA